MRDTNTHPWACALVSDLDGDGRSIARSRSRCVWLVWLGKLVANLAAPPSLLPWSLDRFSVGQHFYASYFTCASAIKPYMVQLSELAEVASTSSQSTQHDDNHASLLSSMFYGAGGEGSAEVR